MGNSSPAVLRIIALSRLHCCALPFSAGEEQEPRLTVAYPGLLEAVRGRYEWSKEVCAAGRRLPVETIFPDLDPLGLERHVANSRGVAAARFLSQVDG
jgi:hypothetical protein